MILREIQGQRKKAEREWCSVMCMKRSRVCVCVYMWSERERVNAPWVFEIDLFWHYYCHPSLDLPSLLFVVYSRLSTYSNKENTHIFTHPSPSIHYTCKYYTEKKRICP